MKELTKRINLKLNDFIIYEEIVYFSSIPKVLGMLFVLALFVLFYIAYKATGTGFLLVAVFGVFIASFVYTAASVIPKKAGEFYKTSPFLKSHPLFTLTKEKIVLDRTSGVSELRLDQILSIVEKFGYFYIYIAKSNFIILPKRDLTKEEIAFVRIVRKSLARKQRRSPYKMKPVQILTTALITTFVTVAIWFLVFYIQNNS